MRVDNVNIHSILNGYKQFVIPVYQRPYSWGQEQCQRLWKDIVRMQKENIACHFVGSFVLAAEQAMPTGVQKFLIIDGQQRMTSLILLLIALRNYSQQHLEDLTVDGEMIEGMCLKNQYDRTNEPYKLVPTEWDREDLFRLIDDTLLGEPTQSRIYSNYLFFEEKVNSRELSPAQIYESIGKLEIVYIILDQGKDNPQLIFESLNSTGLDLSQTDLIRNYLLMSLPIEQQRQIYQTWWHPLEKLFGNESQSIGMDRFFRDYLTMKLGRIPNLNRIYEEFKQYHQKKTVDTIESFMDSLYRYGKKYSNLVFGKESSPELMQAFLDIKALQMEVAYPFLLKVYGDFEEKKITEHEFTEILRLCESYVLRRAICGIPTNSLNKTFATLKNVIREEFYVKSIQIALGSQTSYKEFPKDEAFKREFMMKVIYNARIRNYLLGKLEKYDNKNYVDVTKLTIEHILPQNTKLSPKWQEMIGANWGEVQEKYLHTIGNLTLTAYNSEMSDRSFEQKLEIEGGFKQSALRINDYLIRQTQWNENTIIERAKLLAELACTIWKYPPLTAEEVTATKQVGKKEEYTLENYKHLTGDMKSLFEELERRILNISSDVYRELKFSYIAYKVDTNFVDIVPQKNRLRLTLNMKFSDIIDPKELCWDVTDKGHWGNGDVEFGVNNVSELDDVMDLILQSYRLQAD